MNQENRVEFFFYAHGLDFSYVHDNVWNTTKSAQSNQLILLPCSLSSVWSGSFCTFAVSDVGLIRQIIKWIIETHHLILLFIIWFCVVLDVIVQMCGISDVLCRVRFMSMQYAIRVSCLLLMESGISNVDDQILERFFFCSFREITRSFFLIRNDDTH